KIVEKRTFVGPKDTLNSIALKFNITPNKLVQLNRLYSHSVVPGQVRHSVIKPFLT
uniref:LysM domain-containing protein n=1 Tax=Cyprinus carpio TaxID=7962 RepID=A0A8C1LR96_CYPCA